MHQTITNHVYTYKSTMHPSSQYLHFHRQETQSPAPQNVSYAISSPQFYVYRQIWTVISSSMGWSQHQKPVLPFQTLEQRRPQNYPHLKSANALKIRYTFMVHVFQSTRSSGSFQTCNAKLLLPARLSLESVSNHFGFFGFTFRLRCFELFFQFIIVE